MALAGPASAQAAGPYRFQSDCNSITGTSGFADVPAGTTVSGVGLVLVTTAVTTPNTTVTFPSGATAILNETITNGRNAVHFLTGPNAGVIVGQVTCTGAGATASSLVGSPLTVACPPNAAPAGGVATVSNVTVGSPAGARCSSIGGVFSSAADGVYSVNPYPLAVDAASASAAAPDLATPASTGGGSGNNLLLLAGAGVLGLAVLGQVTISRRMRHTADAAG